MAARLRAGPGDMEAAVGTPEGFASALTGVNFAAACAARSDGRSSSPSMLTATKDCAFTAGAALVSAGLVSATAGAGAVSVLVSATVSAFGALVGAAAGWVAAAAGALSVSMSVLPTGVR